MEDYLSLRLVGMAGLISLILQMGRPQASKGQLSAWPFPVSSIRWSKLHFFLKQKKATLLCKMTF